MLFRLDTGSCGTSPTQFLVKAWSELEKSGGNRKTLRNTEFQEEHERVRQEMQTSAGLMKRRRISGSAAGRDKSLHSARKATLVKNLDHYSRGLFFF